MEKASWKREPASAHVSGKMEGVSQALPQPRALRDFRTHCHHSSLSSLPPAILEFFFSLSSFQPLPLFFWSSRSQQALAVFAPSGHACSALAHHLHGALTPSQLTCAPGCLSLVSPSSHSICLALHFHPASYSH